MSFHDATVRHAVYIERYKAKLAREVMEILSGVSSDLYKAIAASDLDRMSRKDLNSFLVELKRIVNSGYEPAVGQIDEALKSFAVYEAGWQAEAAGRHLSARLAVPSDADLYAAMYARPFQGRHLKDWLKDLPATTSRRVREAVRQGYVDGVSPLEIARSIRGTRTRKGILDISRRGAETMARTAVAHTASVARSRTYKQNPAIKGEQWVSVLDGRTSAICRGRDGVIYEVGEGPRPPAHPNCRSTMVPVTSTNRAALDTRPTYSDWLKKQPASVQDDILGNARGKLFRDGGYTVDKFTDKSGKEYTLDQLKAKDAETFSEVFGG